MRARNFDELGRVGVGVVWQWDRAKYGLSRKGAKFAKKDLLFMFLWKVTTLEQRIGERVRRHPFNLPWGFFHDPLYTKPFGSNSAT